MVSTIDLSGNVQVYEDSFREGREVRLKSCDTVSHFISKFLLSNASHYLISTQTKTKMAKHPIYLAVESVLE